MRQFILLLIITLLIVPVSAQDELIGPDSYPDGINPLTGLPVDDPSILDQRPLMVKIINAPAEVRPQTGLMQADMVWEHLLAGGITRFSAIYLSQSPTYIGPIRSARLVDFELLRIYRALLSYSGMSEGTIQIMRGDPLVISRAVGGTGPCPAFCRFPETADKLEWTLYGDTIALRELAAEQERDVTPQPLSGMAFSEATPDGGIALDSINIAYVNTHLNWEYDETSGLWLRSQDGEVHIDAGTDEQITAANVLILEEEHTEQPFVSDGFWGPGNFAFSVNFIGSGRVVLLRDGQYFEGEWRRETQEDVLTYYDTKGNILPFKPGNTFVNLMPRWVESYQLTFGLEETLTATITASSGNLRGGPGSGYGARGAGFRGDEFPAVGRNGAGDWVQLISDDGVLWGSTQILSLDDDVMLLPLARPTIEG